MRRADKEAWIAALRSGKFTQARGVLTKISRFDGSESDCCLGVACKLFEVPSYIDMERGVRVYEDEQNVLPLSLRARLHIDSNGRTSIVSREFDGESVCLSALNDNGFTFDQIADVIEYEYPVTD